MKGGTSYVVNTKSLKALQFYRSSLLVIKTTIHITNSTVFNITNRYYTNSQVWAIVNTYQSNNEGGNIMSLLAEVIAVLDENQCMNQLDEWFTDMDSVDEVLELVECTMTEFEMQSVEEPELEATKTAIEELMHCGCSDASESAAQLIISEYNVEVSGQDFVCNGQSVPV